jgi:cyclopropane fatty-acyl-phospholipid synthase-like methyltransferase
MKDAFDAYGALARSAYSPVVKAGRRMIQAEAERLIADDVAQKLSLEPEHTLLEIGCGPGAILEPLSERVVHAVGIDHPDMIAIAKERCGTHASFIAGRFPDVTVRETFDLVLAYSVLHYMSDFPATIRFIDAALERLTPRGRLLLGDLPNADKMKRFRATDFGRTFELQWRDRVAPEKVQDPHAIFADVKSIGTFNDAMILELLARYRGRGLHAYVLPQPPDLPTGYTREDVLITLP